LAENHRSALTKTALFPLAGNLFDLFFRVSTQGRRSVFFLDRHSTEGFSSFRYFFFFPTRHRLIPVNKSTSINLVLFFYCSKLVGFFLPPSDVPFSLRFKRIMTVFPCFFLESDQIGVRPDEAGLFSAFCGCWRCCSIPFFFCELDVLCNGLLLSSPFFKRHAADLCSFPGKDFPFLFPREYGDGLIGVRRGLPIPMDCLFGVPTYRHSRGRRIPFFGEELLFSLPPLIVFDIFVLLRIEIDSLNASRGENPFFSYFFPRMALRLVQPAFSGPKTPYSFSPLLIEPSLAAV